MTLINPQHCRCRVSHGPLASTGLSKWQATLLETQQRPNDTDMTPCFLCLNFTNLRLLCVFTSPPFLLNSFQALDFTIGKFHNRRINCSYFVTAQAPSSTVNAIDGGSRFHQLLPPPSFFFCPLAILLCRCVCAGCSAGRWLRYMGVRLRQGAHHRLDAGSQLPALQDHTTVCLHKRPGPRAPQTLAPHMDTKQCHIPAHHEHIKVEHTNVCTRDRRPRGRETSAPHRPHTWTHSPGLSNRWWWNGSRGGLQGKEGDTMLG